VSARPLTAGESLVAFAASAGVAVLLLVDALFLGRSTLAFPLSDPRADVRPWVRAAAPGEALPDVNLATPDIVGLVAPGLLRARALEAAGAAGTAWDDGQLLGFPFAANLHFPVGSHLAWLAAPFEVVQALDVLLALHVALALWLAWRAARLFGAAPPFAALAAAGFALNAWMTSRWHCPPITWASSWFPLQLAALAWARRGRPARAALEMGVGTGLGLLSGFPQAALLLGGAAAALALLDPVVRRPRALAALAVGGAAGLALALPMLLPALRLEPSSLRARPESRAALAASHVPPAALAGLLLPDAFGDAVEFGGEGRPAPTMEAWLPQRRWLAGQLHGNVAEVAGYTGLLLLLLLPVALGGRAGGDARRLALVALAALGGAVAGGPLLAALGLERLVVSNGMRFLSTWCCVLPFAGALAAQAVVEARARLPLATAGGLLLALLLLPVAARALDDPQAPAFAAKLTEDLPRQLLVLLGGLGALALARGGPGTARAWLPALVLAADLGVQARHVNPTVPDEPFPPPTRTVSALLERAPSATERAGHAPRGRVAVLGEAPNLLPPTLASAAGLRLLHGVMSMVPARTADLLACIDGPLFDPADPRVGRGLRDPASLSHPLLDLLGVSAVVCADRALAAESGLPVVLEVPDEGLAVLERPTAGPFAFVCGGALVVPDRDQRLAWLARRDVALFGTALVERPPPFDLPELGGAPGAVTVERPAPGLIRMSCEAAAPGVLVVSEAWDPGWSLRVDGRPAPVEIVDHALLGAFLEPGPHALELRYATPGAGAARAAAWAALAALGAAAALALREARRSPGVPDRR
jgi:hypothetical protein